MLWRNIEMCTTREMWTLKNMDASGFKFTLFGIYTSRKENQQSFVSLSKTQAEYIFLVEGGERSHIVERYNLGARNHLRMCEDML